MTILKKNYLKNFFRKTVSFFQIFLNNSFPSRCATGCEELPLDYTHWSEPATVLVLLLSCLGVAATTYVTRTFLTHAHTCVVKATTRELSFTILAGTYCAYLLTVPLVMRLVKH